MKNITSDFVVGGVARDSDYYFHKAFIDDVWDSLKKDNVLLLSPRRTGKTSVTPCSTFKFRPSSQTAKLRVPITYSKILQQYDLIVYG